MNIGTLPDQSLGFDADLPITTAIAAKFHSAKFSFVARYLPRDRARPFDLSAAEVQAIHAGGLAVAPVQHVAPPHWHPTGALGMVCGATAARAAKAAGLPFGGNVWCDLEEVAAESTSDDVIAYCNEWHEAVERGGYKPGLYVGDSCGLTGEQLYRKLLFEHYWSAYNLNSDCFPAVRGVQMRQHSYPSVDKRVPGILFEYDIDVVKTDALGGSPIFYLP